MSDFLLGAAVGALFGAVPLVLLAAYVGLGTRHADGERDR